MSEPLDSPWDCLRFPFCERHLPDNVDFDSLRLTTRWDHIYRCHKASLAAKHGSAELCFHCDEWITGKQGWREHCRRHLNDLESLPVQWNPLTFRQTLAAAGYCPFCLFNPLLLPEEHFRQYPKKLSWQQELDRHFDGLEKKEELALASHETKATACLDPRCGLSFDAIVDLQHHAQDTHWYKRAQASTSKRRCRTNRQRSKADSFISFAESVYPSDLGNAHQSYSVEEAAAMSNSETDDPAVSPRNCFDALLSSAKPQLSEATASLDSCGGRHPDLTIDPSLSDLELTNLASPLGLGTSYYSERNHSSTSKSPPESEPRTPDALEAPWPVELPILPSRAVTDATASTPSSVVSQQSIYFTVSKKADIAMMQTPLEPRPTTGEWLDLKARNLPPVGANEEDDRTAEDVLAFTGDGDKCTDLGCDLLSSHCTNPNDTIGSLEPGHVDVDAMFDQYLRSPSRSPLPTPSPDHTISELSGATLFDAGCNSSRGCPELYTETLRSPAPEISPESEIAQDQDNSYLSRTYIHLRVSQPKTTLRLKLHDRGQSKKEKRRESIRERVNPGIKREGKIREGR